MANYRAASAAGAGSAYMSSAGNAISEDDTVTPTAALAIGDTIDLVRVAGGTRLQRLTTFNGDFDTGTTLQFKLGYRKVDGSGVLVDVDNFFGSALTTWQAAVLGSSATQWAFAPIYFAEDVYITATVTAAATGVSGTPSITTIAHGKAVGVK